MTLGEEEDREDAESSVTLVAFVGLSPSYMGGLSNFVNFKQKRYLSKNGISVYIPAMPELQAL